MRTEKTMNTMNTIKHPYIAPEGGRCRIFLEDGLAKASVLLTEGGGMIQQNNWDGVAEETRGTAATNTDRQGDLWISF
jgi:hypothetical protein